MYDFGKKLKALRESRNLTQSDLARVLHVGRGLISYYETTARMPSYEVLLKIANFFNVSIDYLLGRKNDDFIDVSNLTDSQKNAIRQLIFSFCDEYK